MRDDGAAQLVLTRDSTRLQVSALMQQRIGGAYVAAPPSLQMLEQQQQLLQGQPQPMSTPRAPAAAAPASFTSLPSAASTPALPQYNQSSPGSATTISQTPSAAAAAPPPSSASQVPSCFIFKSRIIRFLQSSNVALTVLAGSRPF